MDGQMVKKDEKYIFHLIYTQHGLFLRLTGVIN